jgi:ubiquinone/menaquinone biosynthesis C-methylase UbiE
MGNYKETAESWNKIASLYETKFMDLTFYDESYQVICEHLKGKNSRILEIGCGPGNITQFLFRNIPNIHLLGVDIAPEMIRLAQKNIPKAKFQVLDSREISTINQTFDAIVCGFCIPYMPNNDVFKLTQDVYSMLNTNGLFYLSFVAGPEEKSCMQTNSQGDKMYFNYHCLEKIESNLRNSGFCDLQKLEIEYPKGNQEIEIHTVLIAYK